MMKRKSINRKAAALGVGCILALSGLLIAMEEVHVTLEELPAAVRATLLKEAGGAAITEIERETEDGQTVYEAEFEVNGEEVEVKIAPDGTLLGREIEDKEEDEAVISADQVPAPALAALMKAAGGATIAKMEMDHAHGATIYEAEWSVNGVGHEAAVTAEGALVELEETTTMDKLPAAVRQAVIARFGAGADVVVERKMIVLYEAEGRIDGEGVEILIFPTGVVHEQAGRHDDHDDDDHGNGHDDDHDDDDGPDDDD